MSTTLRHVFSSVMRDAEDHRRARVAGGAKRDAEHEEQHHPAAEQEHDAEERQRLGVHRRRGVHEVEQPWRDEIAERAR